MIIEITTKIVTFTCAMVMFITVIVDFIIGIVSGSKQLHLFSNFGIANFTTDVVIFTIWIVNGSKQCCNTLVHSAYQEMSPHVTV